jgi:hypothetical protein
MMMGESNLPFLLTKKDYNICLIERRCIMKKVILLILVIISSFAVFTISIHGQPMEFYVGVKSGLFLLGKEWINDIYPVGVLLGYGIPTGFKIFGFAFECELNYGLFGGDFVLPGFYHPGEGNTDMWTVALYTVVSISMGDVAYLKAKTGYLYENVITTIDDETDSEDDTGFSFSGGAGFNITDKVRAEAEFTVIQQDVNFISLGVNYSF